MNISNKKAKKDKKVHPLLEGVIKPSRKKKSVGKHAEDVGNAVRAIKSALTTQDGVPDVERIEVHPGGRPPKYGPSMVTKAYEYINNCEDTYYNYQKGFGSTDTFERRVVVKIPTYEGLSLHLGVHRDTLRDWREKYKEFSVSLEFLLQKQKEMLIRGSLSGDYTPLIAKLILSSNHGMKERVDSTSDDKPLPPANVTINTIKTLSNEELIRLAEGGASGTSS